MAQVSNCICSSETAGYLAVLWSYLFHYEGQKDESQFLLAANVSHTSISVPDSSVEPIFRFLQELISQKELFKHTAEKIGL